MAAGENCFGVISNTGEVYTWGEDGIKIGLGTKRSQPIPFRVPIITKCIDLGTLFSRKLDLSLATENISLKTTQKLLEKTI